MMTNGRGHEEDVKNSYFSNNTQATKHSHFNLRNKFHKSKHCRNFKTTNWMQNGSKPTSVLISDSLKRRDFEETNNMAEAMPTHMTLNEGTFENSSKRVATYIQKQQQPKIAIAAPPPTTQRINKPKLQAALNGLNNNATTCMAYGEQHQQQEQQEKKENKQQQKQLSLCVRPSDPACKVENPTTILPTLLSSTAREDMKNSVNETQCNVAGIACDVSPKQKRAHHQLKQEKQEQEQQEQQQQEQMQLQLLQEQQKLKQKGQHNKYAQQQQSHCKSANIRCSSSSTNSSNIINFRSICTLPTHTDNGILTITTTTNNISDNSTTNAIAITDNNAIIINSATRPPAASATSPSSSPSPFSLFSLSQSLPSSSSPPSSSSSSSLPLPSSSSSSSSPLFKTTTATTIPAAATYCNAYSALRRMCIATIQMESVLLRAMMFSLVFIMSLQYQSVAASTSMMTKHEPMFISRSETFKFVAGDTIVLPCEVANTDPYVVAWKRGIAILTAGSVKVTPDPRVRLVNGFNLQIRDAVPQDAGDYICQIATMEPREITHTVEILVPPRIHHISTSGHLQVKKGSSVRIECSASGNPTPNVTWSRKNNILPNGEEKLHSHILSIENVDRHKGGVYICTANNGVGQPASSQVVLHVLYPPEITVERPVVFSGEGHEAMLVCIVHGETQPEVIWFKDTMQLDTTERHIMENRGSRHTLIIRKVHPQDFGNYSCVAENQLGKSRKTLQLSGKPNVAVFNSPPISQYKDRYNISWTVESHAPIEEYKLSFRRLQQGQEVDNSIDSLHSSSSSSSTSMLRMYGGSMDGSSSTNVHNYRLGSGGVVGMNNLGNMGGSGGYGSYGAGNVIHWGRNDWRDVVLPAIPISHHYTQGMSYMIRGLDPDQHYEATVQARNRYGWSDYSQSFVFSTSSNDNEMRDLSVTFYGSKSSRIAADNYRCIMPTILAIIFMWYLKI